MQLPYMNTTTLVAGTSTADWVVTMLADNTQVIGIDLWLNHPIDLVSEIN